MIIINHNTDIVVIDQASSVDRPATGAIAAERS